MMCELIPGGTEQQALQAEKGEHLRRLARFALVDDVPDPWGSAGLATDRSTGVGGMARDE